MKTKHMTTLHLRNSIGRSPLRRRSFNEGGSLITYYYSLLTILHLRRGFLLIPLVLAWFALSPTARAVLPAPDGGYPNNNTAEGFNALFSLTTGYNNTANGVNALLFNTSHDNTATGFQALSLNTTGHDNTANGGGALQNNDTGYYNTANGVNALFSNNTGYENTANGVDALYSNTTGLINAANGFC